MCGVLTASDFQRYGHSLLPEANPPVVGPQGRSLGCVHELQDEWDLFTQPTARTAAAALDQLHASNTRGLVEHGLPRQPLDNPLPGADASWFDVSSLTAKGTAGTYHVIGARRGPFYFTITLAGLVGAHEKDAREVLVGLATLVLQRISDVGTPAAGTDHVVHYLVTGPGTATITYLDPELGRQITLPTLPLPWLRDIPFPDNGTAPVLLQVMAAGAAPLGAGRLSCRIVVDGVLADQQAGQAAALCLTSFAGAPVTASPGAGSSPG
jgi:Mycobacterium membrane protein